MITIGERYKEKNEYRVAYGGTVIWCDRLAFDKNGIFFYLNDILVAALVEDHVKNVNYSKIYNRLQEQWAEVISKEYNCNKKENKV